MTVQGWPKATIIRGTVVMRDGQLIGTAQGKPMRFNLCPAVESIFQREGAKVCGKFTDHQSDDNESSEAQAIDSGSLRVFAPSR
jgi:hypothetical protein